MNALKAKAIILILLTAVLGTLVFMWLNGSGGSFEKELTILEKYYSPNPEEKALGIKTKEPANIHMSSEGPTCAMKFSNEQIFVLDCDKYLDYQIGDEVVISHQDGKVTEIRKKE
ncbi:hypothetical protein D0469_05575 [Peribacillus saganii]|uniref:Uncharacterized protein n=1 Tax=Peribacillus saganii TaxID=2303992 RepID=A0A372LS90_9BACI|nr:hypothetical protein [Peribacillus saganii]RFU70680.1 hypothetical protein D0469_05575 [Peribacillus saganii]